MEAYDVHVGTVYGAQTAVHKEECTRCFDTWNTEGGVYVCLTCFDGGCERHARQHAQRQEHPLAVNVRRVKKAEEEAAGGNGNGNGGAAAGTGGGELTTIGIGVAGGALLDAEKSYEYKTRVQLFGPAAPGTIDPTYIGSDGQYAPRSVEDSQLSDAVRAAVASVMAANSASRSLDVKEWTNTVITCEHTAALQQDAGAHGVVKAKALSMCGECALAENLWLCLTCGHLGCGRANMFGLPGNGHGVAHHDASKHPVVCKLGTITPEGDADIHCYACDEMRLDSELGAHLSFLGMDISAQVKTERTIAEHEVAQNKSLDFQSTLAEAAHVTPLDGPHHTGMHNLGNTCYMASAVQVLLSLDFYRTRYAPDVVEAHTVQCSKRPEKCWQCQMHKLADGLASGRYAPPKAGGGGGSGSGAGDNDNEDGVNVDESKATEATPDDPLRGVTPRMFKHLVCNGHAEFGTNQQQDAAAFFHYLLETLDRNERALPGAHPLQPFAFKSQQRLQCTGCGGISLQEVSHSELSVPLAVARAEPPVVRADGEKAADLVVRERGSSVPMAACMEQYGAVEDVEKHCHVCGTDKLHTKINRFVNFPPVLALTLQRYTAEDWVPRKLGYTVTHDAAGLNLSAFAVRPLADDEHMLPDAPPAAQAAPAPRYKDADVDQLMSMGFPANRCKRALIATGGVASGPETAMNWLLSHMDEPGIDDPLEEPAPATAAVGSGAAAGAVEVPDELVAQLQEFGFPPKKARKALRLTSLSVERAVEWLFSHPDDDGEDDAPAPAAAASTAAVAGASAPVIDERPPKYVLHAVIEHRGTSAHCGHYIAYVRERLPNSDGGAAWAWVRYNDNKVDRVPDALVPLGSAYMYFYRKAD